MERFLLELRRKVEDCLPLLQAQVGIKRLSAFLGDKALDLGRTPRLQQQSHVLCGNGSAADKQPYAEITPFTVPRTAVAELPARHGLTTQRTIPYRVTVKPDILILLGR